MDRRAAEHTTQTIHQRLTTTLSSQRPDHTGERTERIGATLGLGAVMALPGACPLAALRRALAKLLDRRRQTRDLALQRSTLPIRSSCSQGGRSLSVHMAEV